jgi:hypothetical protein
VSPDDSYVSFLAIQWFRCSYGNPLRLFGYPLLCVRGQGCSPPKRVGVLSHMVADRTFFGSGGPPLLGLGVPGCTPSKFDSHLHMKNFLPRTQISSRRKSTFHSIFPLTRQRDLPQKYLNQNITLSPIKSHPSPLREPSKSAKSTKIQKKSISKPILPRTTYIIRKIASNSSNPLNSNSIQRSAISIFDLPELSSISTQSKSALKLY